MPAMICIPHGHQKKDFPCGKHVDKVYPAVLTVPQPARRNRHSPLTTNVLGGG